LSRDKFIRFSLTFHETFAPENNYLSKIIEFSATKNNGTIKEISDVTSIPTGRFSGKVVPTIKYAQGMGLINVERPSEGGYKLYLTALGLEVFEQDKYLKEEMTQWLLHLMFCRRHGGAEAWYSVFGEGHLPLGRIFSRDAVSAYLKTTNDNVSPLWRMYSNSSGFTLCNALEENDGVLVRTVAPMTSDFFSAYAFFLLSAWEVHFTGDQQFSISDFEDSTKVFATLGFNDTEVNTFLDWMSDKGYVQIDRLTGEALILKLVEAKTTIKSLYDSLV